MTVLARLGQWKSAGAITEAQPDVIATLARRDRFSVFIELNALLYPRRAGVRGRRGLDDHHLPELGDAAIVSALTCAFSGAFYYCFTHGLPYARARSSIPGSRSTTCSISAACCWRSISVTSRRAITRSAPHGTIRCRWRPAVFFALAYRFDNVSCCRSRCRRSAPGSDSAWPVRPVLRGLDARLPAYGSLVAVAGAASIAPALRNTSSRPTSTSRPTRCSPRWCRVPECAAANGRSTWPPCLRWPRSPSSKACGSHGSRSSRMAWCMPTPGSIFACSRDAIGHHRPRILAVSGTIVILALTVLARRFGRDA